MIPSGAREIVEARKRGLKPADMVIVSLVGKVNELNPVVYANPGAIYDWGWCVGLSLCLFVRPGVVWKELALSVARSNPEYLAIWDVDQFKGTEAHALPTVESIDRPRSRWDWKLHFIPWLRCQNEEFNTWN